MITKKLRCNNCGSTRGVVEVFAPSFRAYLCRDCQSPQRLAEFARKVEAEMKKRDSGEGRRLI